MLTHFRLDRCGHTSFDKLRTSGKGWHLPFKRSAVTIGLVSYIIAKQEP